MQGEAFSFFRVRLNFRGMNLPGEQVTKVDEVTGMFVKSWC
jgi:hypothetical protein